MIEWLEGIDRELLLAINGAHHPVLDEIMWLISGKLTWIPLYVYLMYLAYQRLGLQNFIWFVLFVVLTIALADQTSVHLFKNTIARYRPSQNLDLWERLHLYTLPNGSVYRGGQFGFVSSHATNFAALTTFVVLSIKLNRGLVIILAIAHFLICYSRVYLGVHYPADVVAGTLLGCLVGYSTAKGFTKLRLSGDRNPLGNAL
jgi:undecaprenyl-diphosphatase